MSDRGRSASRRPREADSRSDQCDESSDGGSGMHAKKRGAHGGRGSPADVPDFMKLSGDAAESGRRSSRSRSSSPASSVEGAQPVSGGGRLSTDDDVLDYASRHVRGEGGASLSAAHATTEDDLEPYGGRCHWCLCVRSVHSNLVMAHAHALDAHALD